MKLNLNHPIIKRIRKPESDFYEYLRLNRAEFGHSFNSKKSSFDFNKYYPNVSKIINALKKYTKLSEKNLLIGLGAESIIKDTLFIFSKKKKRIGFLTPNYFMYSIYSRLFGYKIFNLNINPEFSKKLSIENLKKFIKKKNIDIFILVNPSHPFEKNWKLDEIELLLKYCKKKKITLIIDEVYQGLGSQSSKKFINKYDNLIIISSLSKNIGLPALRVGYLMASEKIVEYMDSFRLAIELPHHSIKVSCDYLKNKKKITSIKKNIIKARKYAHSEFKKRKIPAFGKFGNSVTFKIKDATAAKSIGESLKKNKILINYNYKKPYDIFLNLTTTNVNNIKIFFSKLDQVYKRSSK